MKTLAERHADAHATLDTCGQLHVLAHHASLTDTQQDALLCEVEGIDWPEVKRLIETHVKQTPEFKIPENLEPAPWFAYTPTDADKPRYAQARTHGETLIAEGKVAAFTVAGGQGTRLGWDAPKGTFPATVQRGLPLFSCFAEYLIKTQEKYGATIPWYVMTSPINDAPTRAFFEEQNHFGLDPANVMIFPQAMMPAIDIASHKVLLKSKHELALSPNGHGGSLKALFTQGAIADMQKRGIEQISYTQVDNPIVRMIDPLFIGLHDLENAQMSSKMLPKAFAKEKLGNFCLVNGKMTVIEYSNLPDDIAEQTTPDGELRFRAGSIALHCIRTDFVQTLNTGADGFSLPFNRAEKKVPFYDAAANTTVNPTDANAIKLETFVFDALPMTDSSIIYETDRTDEFAPIKNADIEGKIETDSPASSKQIQTERAARWLETRGVSVPRNADGTPNANIEIKQTTAIYPEDLADIDLPDAIKPGATVLL
ncbi:MAG: UDPGP type 1 family protein [Algisphaera sp.]